MTTEVKLPFRLSTQSSALSPQTPSRNSWWRVTFVIVWICGATPAAYALDALVVRQLAAENSEAKIEAIDRLVTAGDPAAIPVLKALQDDQLSSLNGRLVIVTDAGIRDALTGEALHAPSDELEAVVINNRLRGALDGAIAALRLGAPDRAERLAAAKAVAAYPSDQMLPLIKRAFEKESDPDTKALLGQARAVIEIKSPDAAVRRQAVQLLARSSDPQTKQLLTTLVQKNPDGGFAEPDDGVRADAQKAISAIEERFILPQILGMLFSGLSLGSVLLLTALGLAITFGLMGIKIGRAHV